MVACWAHAPKDVGSNPASDKHIIGYFMLMACIT